MADKQQSTFRTSIGGQALMEGIMMRGPDKQAIVVRTEDGLIVKESKLKFIKDKYPILGWPLIRGTVNLIGSMVEGVKAMTFSAECLPEEEQEEPSRFEKWVNGHVSGEKADKILTTTAVVLGIALAIGLFVLLPTLIAGWIPGLPKGGAVRSLIEGVLRIFIFILYLYLVSKMKDIKRVWQYHGAEHKTIFCYEKGLDMTVENARTQSCHHPRCGTSFLFIVMIISILVFSIVRWSDALMRIVMRLVLLPVVVGISYEIIKLAGRYDNWLTRIISAPGKALQYLTTKEPDDSMLEVAIKALELVIPDEKGKDQW